MSDTKDALVDLGCHVLEVKAAIEAKRQELAQKDYDPYDEGWDDALCWVLDLIEGKQSG